MDNPNTIFDQEKLLQLYAALPQNLKDAIFSVDSADKIMKAGKKFGLNVEQTGILAEQAGLVMLGALHPRNFIQRLEEEMKVDRTKAVDVAKEINHEIFFPVREALKKIHGMEDTEEVTSEKSIAQGDFLKKIADLRGKTATAPSPKTPLHDIRPSVPPASSPQPSAETKPPSYIPDAQKRPPIDMPRPVKAPEPPASLPVLPPPVKTPSSPGKFDVHPPSPRPNAEALKKLLLEEIEKNKNSPEKPFSPLAPSEKKTGSMDSPMGKPVPEWAKQKPEGAAIPPPEKPVNVRSGVKVISDTEKPQEKKPGPAGDLYREPIE
jgi:hypothetical protein